MLPGGTPQTLHRQAVSGSVSKQRVQSSTGIMVGKSTVGLQIILLASVLLVLVVCTVQYMERFFGHFVVELDDTYLSIL